MKRKQLQQIGQALAIAGLLAVLGGAVYWLITRDFGTITKIALFGGLAVLAIAAVLQAQNIGNFAKTRQARYGAESAVTTIAVIALLIALNYILADSRLRKTWDVTADKVNTLAPESSAALEKLPSNVEALVFYPPEFQDTNRDLFDRYQTSSAGKFSYRFVDANREPAMASQYQVTQNGIVVLKMADRTEKVDVPTEQEITGGLLRLITPKDYHIYFVTGHQEYDSAGTDQKGLGTVVERLKRLSYKVDTLNLANEIPSDATVLVIAGALLPYSEAETTKLSTYLEKGGRLMVLAEPAVMSPEPDLAQPLYDYLKATWGVELRNDVVVDVAYAAMQGNPTAFVAAGYGESTITKNLQSANTVYITARSLQLAAPSTDIQLTPLVLTSEQAWGETTLDDPNLAPNGNDAVGELVIAASAENVITKARVVVFGDSDFATNDPIQQNIVGNAFIFQNAVNWAIGEDTLLEITPNDQTTREHRISTASDYTVLWLTSCILPVAVVAGLGVMVWQQRRKRN